MKRGSNVRSAFALVIMAVLFVVFPFGKLAAQTVNVTTLAGGDPYYNDGAAALARFNNPNNVAVDGTGNIFVAENGRIRKIDINGIVTTLAGNGSFGYADGTGTSAIFSSISSIATDALSNLYVADGNRIRKITSGGVVSTLAGNGNSGYADGMGTSAIFNNPLDIVVDASGNVYVADANNYRIRKIIPSGMVTTLAGSGSQGYVNGLGTSAMFGGVRSITLDNTGNLLVMDVVGVNNYYLRKISLVGEVTTLMTVPAYYTDIVVDNVGNIYGSTGLNRNINKISINGTITNFAGSGVYNLYGDTDGIGATARFMSTNGIALDASQNIIVADALGQRIRKVSPQGEVTKITGSELQLRFDYGYGAGYLNRTFAKVKKVSRLSLIFTQTV